MGQRGRRVGEELGTSVGSHQGKGQRELALLSASAAGQVSAKSRTVSSAVEHQTLGL